MSFNRNKFLEDYQIDHEDLNLTNVTWAELEAIFKAYSATGHALKPVGEYLLAELQSLDGVHSVKLRIKDPYHLIEKVIRKRKESPNRRINAGNYSEEITDLIGLRALHLFKEDWSAIHEQINTRWELHETPCAYVREGDPPDVIANYKTYGCNISIHPMGYRSVHYVVKTKPSKKEHLAEIQLRTVFEEGWSEIDHTVRYPREQKNPLLIQFLSLFNRLSGSADEMGSFVRLLTREMEPVQQNFSAALAQRDEKVEQLQDAIAKLNVTEQEKTALLSTLNSIPRVGMADLDVIIKTVAAAEQARCFQQYVDDSRKPEYTAAKQVIAEWGDRHSGAFQVDQVLDNGKFGERLLRAWTDYQSPESDSVRRARAHFNKYWDRLVADFDTFNIGYSKIFDFLADNLHLLSITHPIEILLAQQIGTRGKPNLSKLILRFKHWLEEDARRIEEYKGLGVRLEVDSTIWTQVWPWRT